MPIHWEFHWEEHIPKPQYMLYYWWLHKLQRLVNQLEIELCYEWSCFFYKNTDSTMSVDTIFMICGIMFKCLYLISFKHGFLQTYSSRRIFWCKQFCLLYYSEDLYSSTGWCSCEPWFSGANFYLSLIYFDCLVLVAQRVLYHQGVVKETLSLPDDPCPPDLGGLGQKVEIFDGPPLPAPFGTNVPSCPLARGPGAVLLVGRGLVGSSSELTSWIALLLLIVSISISFSSSFEAADCRADSVLGIVVSYFCSGVVCGGGGCFIWRRCISRNWIFWSDFI